MGMKRYWDLLLANVALGGAATLAGAVLGLLLSLFLGAFLHPEALEFKLAGSGTIETRKLEAFTQMQTLVVVFCAAFGFLSAQTVFLVAHLGRHAEAPPPDTALSAQEARL